VSKPLDYRPAAAVMLLNAANKVFVAQRLDSSLDAWQMPQGGLDPGEDARAGALRELEEETSISPALVEFIAQSSKELIYDLPPDLAGKLWTGRYAGQRQHWFLMRFLGLDTDVDLMTKHPEFRTFQWVDPWLLPELIVPFKRSLYEAVLAEFAQYLPARDS